MLNSERYMRLLHDNAKAACRRPLVAESKGEEATLYLYDVIAGSRVEAEWFGGVCPEDFVKTLSGLTAKKIHIRINSPGGSVFGGRAIEAAIRAHGAEIIGHVDGYAASAASFVAVACSSLEMQRGAFLMIHKAWTCMCGNANDMKDTAEFLEKVDGTLAETYAQKCGKPKEEMAAMMEAETWLTAEEALEIGLADSIENADAKASAWDLSAYAKAPAPTSGDNISGEQADDHGVKAPVADESEDNRGRYERLDRLHGTKRPADSRAA